MNSAELRIPIDRTVFDRRAVLICSLSVALALVTGFIARLLVAVIDLVTNLAFYGRLSLAPVSPAGHSLGWAVVFVPVIGGGVVGLMARYGSKAIRGHGIPEAMEQVLLNESRISPRVLFLKPLSAAISIGTGGPFGAEGPIIATGGAFGSFVGQVIRITAVERKTLLAAGAAAGMAATFGSPVSAVLLAVELLLFELRPRSIIAVSLAAVTATAVRVGFVGYEPAFAMPLLERPVESALAAYVVLGAVVGVLSVYVTRAVYWIEDRFEHLPVHWMWWPAIGGIAVGIVGFFAPRTLGVGYTNIDDLVSGKLIGTAALLLCTLKFVSWAISLGSGTSGGTLAPLLTIGGGAGVVLGGLAARTSVRKSVKSAPKSVKSAPTGFESAPKGMMSGPGAVKSRPAGVVSTPPLPFRAGASSRRAKMEKRRLAVAALQNRNCTPPPGVLSNMKVLLAALLLAVPVAAQPDAEFVTWARERAVPIDANGAVFRSLDGAIARARLIGVGESVHDSEPFLSFRTQLLQDLVRRHRVTALVLESGLPEAMALDDYVRGRTATVDFDAALPGGYGSLEEVRRGMEWLRAWNLGDGRARPVGVYGADIPARSGSMVPALDRLLALTSGDRVVKSLVDSIRPVAVQASGRYWRDAAQKYEPLPAEARAGLARDVSLLVERVQMLARGDEQQLEWARRLAAVVQQNEAVLRFGMFDPTVPRDHALADNTLWVVRRLGPGERAVYWAHNAHVQKVPVQGAPLPPGSFLGSGMRFDTVLGDEYLAIATAYGGPSRDDSSAAAEGSVDAALQKVGKGPFLLQLSSDAWLSQERQMRFQTGYLNVVPGKAFDAVAYFPGATRAARVTP